MRRFESSWAETFRLLFVNKIKAVRMHASPSVVCFVQETNDEFKNILVSFDNEK